MPVRFDEENLWRRLSLDDLAECVKGWDEELLKAERERLEGEMYVVEEELIRRARMILGEGE